MTLAAPIGRSGAAGGWPLAGTGAAVLALAILPPLRDVLEGRLVTHVLVQLPLLAAAGALFGRALLAVDGGAGRGGGWNAGGLPGLLLALFTAAFWMLPRSLDAALADPAMAAAKFVSLPMLLGLPLALSWPRLHPLARGVVWAKLLSMLGFLGWLYLAAPLRLCNFYRLDDQGLLGRALLATGAMIALGLAVRAFLAPAPERDRPSRA